MTRGEFRGLLTAVLLCAWVLPVSVHASEYCRRQPRPALTAAQAEKFDGAVLLLSTHEILEAENRHLPWGYPSREAKLLYHREFIFQYRVERKVPVWASYRLERKDVTGGVERVNSFRTDPRFQDDETARCGDYEGSGYDRGHNVPSGDLSRSARAQAHSFFLSNMAPQYHAFNDGIWKYLEIAVRAWAKKYGAVHVITGSIFDWDEDGTPDPTTRRISAAKRVGVPSHFFKIVLRERPDGELAVLAAVLPHRNQRVAGDRREPYMTRHLVRVADIERVTGLKFFPEMTPSLRLKLEQAVASELWPRN